MKLTLPLVIAVIALLIVTGLLVYKWRTAVDLSAVRRVTAVFDPQCVQKGCGFNGYKDSQSGQCLFASNGMSCSVAMVTPCKNSLSPVVYADQHGRDQIGLIINQAK